VLAAPLLAASLLLPTGCAPGVYGRPPVSPAPEVPWVAPPQAIQPSAAAPAGGSLAGVDAMALPEGLPAGEAPWSLLQIVDIALRNNVQTRVAWAAARAASAEYAGRTGEYFPEIHVGATATRQQTASSGGRATMRQSTASPFADLSWMLFDFGGREAYVDEARQALIAADWTHNAAIQDVILQVEQAYVDHVATKVLFLAEESTVEEARAALEAAQNLHDSGLGTIGDVLQARTALSQSLLRLETLRGRIQTTRGVLATSMGLPANAEYDVVMPAPDAWPAVQTSLAVDSLMAVAQRQRPDLQAARAHVREAQAHARDVQAEGYPALNATGAAGRSFYEDSRAAADTWSASVGISVPVFTGFSHGHDVERARVQAEAAGEEARGLEQSVLLEVWTAYQELKTAEQRLLASEDLLQSATESHEVAGGRYREGVGSILDLLAAQAALEEARAQRVQARADWIASLARLAHSTGTLVPPGEEIGR
jgi:outer membrane protein